MTAHFIPQNQNAGHTTELKGNQGQKRVKQHKEEPKQYQFKTHTQNKSDTNSKQTPR